MRGGIDPHSTGQSGARPAAATTQGPRWTRRCWKGGVPSDQPANRPSGQSGHRPPGAPDPASMQCSWLRKTHPSSPARVSCRFVVSLWASQSCGRAHPKRHAVACPRRPPPAVRSLTARARARSICDVCTPLTNPTSDQKSSSRSGHRKGQHALLISGQRVQDRSAWGSSLAKGGVWIWRGGGCTATGC
jgi:hypothetical protein